MRNLPFVYIVLSARRYEYMIGVTNIDNKGYIRADRIYTYTFILYEIVY